jgi:hypothetical protein
MAAEERVEIPGTHRARWPGSSPARELASEADVMFAVIDDDQHATASCSRIMSVATCSAVRVFPTPPAPVGVTRRAVSKSALISESHMPVDRFDRAAQYRRARRARVLGDVLLGPLLRERKEQHDPRGNESVHVRSQTTAFADRLHMYGGAPLPEHGRVPRLSEQPLVGVGKKSLLSCAKSRTALCRKASAAPRRLCRE